MPTLWDDAVRLQATGTVDPERRLQATYLRAMYEDDPVVVALIDHAEGLEQALDGADKELLEAESLNRETVERAGRLERYTMTTDQRHLAISEQIFKVRSEVLVTLSMLNKEQLTGEDVRKLLHWLDQKLELAARMEFDAPQ